MNEQIFRKKSLDRINSPENLNDYIKVTRPAVWLVFAAIVFLLAGACIWGIYGRMETKVKAVATVEDGIAVCTLDLEEIQKAEEGMPVFINGTEGTILIVDAEEGTLSAKIDVEDGSYAAEIVLESIKPISFVLN